MFLHYRSGGEGDLFGDDVARACEVGSGEVGEPVCDDLRGFVGEEEAYLAI